MPRQAQVPDTSAHVGPPTRLAYPPLEAAGKLGISRAHLYNLIARGEIRVVHLGRSVRVPASELLRLADMGGDA